MLFPITSNEELVRFLARRLGVPLRDVEVVAGHASKSKRVRISGVTIKKVTQLIG